MSKAVTLSASWMEPKDLLGENSSLSVGMFLPSSPVHPHWWPKRGENVHITITEAQLLSSRTKDALSIMRAKLTARGCSCSLEFKYNKGE